MLENITQIDLNIISLYTRDYTESFSIMQMTKSLKINYSHAFKRIKLMVKNQILKKDKSSQISINIHNIQAIKLLSFVEESRPIKNSTLELLVKQAILIDPFCCIGMFGSRVSGKAGKDSDWDVFIISKETRRMQKILSKFPHARNIQLQVFSLSEFQDSLLSTEETVVKHIIRNKHILYNPHPFYSIVYKLEMIKYAPTS